MLRLKAWDILRALLFADEHEDLESLGHECSADERLQQALIGLANASLATASLWVAIRQRALAGHFSDTVCEYLAAFHELNTDRSRTIRGQIAECFAVLNRCGIEPMPLKGAAHLLSGVYADPGERFLSDIDLLIPSARIQDASRALAGLGYFAAPSNFDYSRHHHLPVLVRTLDEVAVELHTAPVLEDAQSALNVDSMWQSASRVAGVEGNWRLASATDTAMLTFLHAEVVDRYLARFIVDLRTYLDLRLFVRHSGSDIDWSFNRDRAAACGASRAFDRLLHVFETLTGARVLPAARPGIRVRAHYFLCRRAIDRPAIQRVASNLSAHRIRKRYSIGTNPLILNAYRVRALGGMIRNRIWRRRENRPDPEPE